jgi:hypothetical protein
MKANEQVVRALPRHKIAVSKVRHDSWIIQRPCRSAACHVLPARPAVLPFLPVLPVLPALPALPVLPYPPFLPFLPFLPT